MLNFIEIKKKILLASLLLKKIEKIIKTENIDIFFTMFNANFINNCIYYMTKKTKKLNLLIRFLTGIVL